MRKDAEEEPGIEVVFTDGQHLTGEGRWGGQLS